MTDGLWFGVFLGSWIVGVIRFRQVNRKLRDLQRFRMAAADIYASVEAGFTDIETALDNQGIKVSWWRRGAVFTEHVARIREEVERG